MRCRIQHHTHAHFTYVSWRIRFDDAVADAVIANLLPQSTNGTQTTNTIQHSTAAVTPEHTIDTAVI